MHETSRTTDSRADTGTSALPPAPLTPIQSVTQRRQRAECGLVHLDLGVVLRSFIRLASLRVATLHRAPPLEPSISSPNLAAWTLIVVQRLSSAPHRGN